MKRMTSNEYNPCFNCNFYSSCSHIRENFPVCPERARYDRLAAIEDILGDEYDLDELREMVQAKRKGRCIVLPCKIGDPMWRLYDDCDLTGDCYTKQKCKGCEYRNLFIEEQAFCLSMLGQNGKLNPPYYTTREEAEAALKAREALDDGNE